MQHIWGHIYHHVRKIIFTLITINMNTYSTSPVDLLCAFESQKMLCQVSTVDGEPLELFSELLLRRAASGSYQHKCNNDNPGFKSMCEKVNKGETPDSRKESAGLTLGPFALFL